MDKIEYLVNQAMSGEERNSYNRSVFERSRYAKPISTSFKKPTPTNRFDKTSVSIRYAEEMIAGKKNDIQLMEEYGWSAEFMELQRDIVGDYLIARYVEELGMPAIERIFDRWVENNKFWFPNGFDRATIYAELERRKEYFRNYPVPVTEWVTDWDATIHNGICALLGVSVPVRKDKPRKKTTKKDFSDDVRAMLGLPPLRKKEKQKQVIHAGPEDYVPLPPEDSMYTVDGKERYFVTQEPNPCFRSGSVTTCECGKRFVGETRYLFSLEV